MFQAMTSAFLALLLAGTASAVDITSMIGNGNGQGAPNNDQPSSQNDGYYNSAPSASNSGSNAAVAAPYSASNSGSNAAVAAPSASNSGSNAGYTTFDPNAAAPILSPGQAPSSQAQGSVSYGNQAAQPWSGPQAVQSNGQDPMAAMLGGAGSPPANSPSSPRGNGGGQYFDSAPSGSNSQPSGGGQPMGGGQPATNPMQTLLGAMTGNMGAQQGNNGGGGGIESQPLISHGQVNSQVLSVDSKEVVSGLIEAFMHKYALDDGEKRCLEDNIGQLTGDIMGTIGDIVVAIKSLVAGGGKLTQDSQGPMVNAGLDSAMKITGLVTSASSLAKGCVHGDALKMLKDTAHHMIDAKYLRHRFLVNGVDIAHDLADAVVAFEHHDFHRFGSDIGTSLRKILLSKANHATRLPEGVPEQDIIQQAMDGLVSGFFVNGAKMEITDTARADVDIRVDLHQCMAGNEEFFKEIFLALWQLIAQLSAHGVNGMGAMFQKNGGGGGQPKWAGELMIAMMQFPMALSKCGISANAQSMLMEAVKTLQDLKVHFTFPQDQIQAEEATDKMAKAVEAWTNWNFQKFGFELGKLFRELVMLAFPQQYSVDASGRLQRMSAEALPRSFSSPLVMISGAAIFSFIALAVVRTRRALPEELPDHSAPMTDIEDGDDLEFVE